MLRNNRNLRRKLILFISIRSIDLRYHPSPPRTHSRSHSFALIHTNSQIDPFDRLKSGITEKELDQRKQREAYKKKPYFMDGDRLRINIKEAQMEVEVLKMEGKLNQAEALQEIIKQQKHDNRMEVYTVLTQY